MTPLTRHRHRSAARRRGALVLAILFGATVALLPLPSAGAATPPVLLGTADSFAILAGSGITNTGATTVTGDVGTFPTPSETGFGSLTLHGVNHRGDAVTRTAKGDLTTAYDQAAASEPTSVATELGGRTLTPGVYGNGTLGITGTLTLDTQGDPHAVFVFQADTTLISATDSAVVILGGGEACNVFWQVGSSATLGTRSHLVGSVLALTSITATTGATVQGRLLARTGAVTLDHNTLTRATCTDSTTTTGAGGSTTVPTGDTTGDTTRGTTDVTANPTPSGPTSASAGPGPTIPEGGSSLPPTETVDTPGRSAPPAKAPPGSGVPRLPFTGADSGRLALLGIVLIGIGGSAMAFHRRLTPVDA